MRGHELRIGFMLAVCLSWTSSLTSHDLELGNVFRPINSGLANHYFLPTLSLHFIFFIFHTND